MYIVKVNLMSRNVTLTKDISHFFTYLLIYLFIFIFYISLCTYIYIYFISL